MTRFSMLILAGALASGCVSKGKYNELESMYDAAVAERDQAQAERDAASEKADKLKGKLQARTAAFTSVYETLVQIREKKLAKVKIEDGRAVLQLESDVLFASGSADLTKEGKAAVQEIAKLLGAGDGTFQVEGHTDSDAIKSKVFPTNWHLGSARAINVTAAMIEAGMPASRVSAASFGDTKPVAANDTAEHKAENRRIELVWVPELSEVLDFKRMLKEMKKDSKEEKEE
jgi:chemotaxis protein MotB